MKMKKINLLYKINYLPSLKKLITIVHKSNPQITEHEIKKYYENHITTQLTKPQPKSKPTGHITALVKDELWQMDIFDLSRYQRYNKEYKYLLVAVDVFSRKAFVEPMKNRNTPAVLEAFEEMTNIFFHARLYQIMMDRL